MGRFTFNILTAISLIFCLTIGSLWIASFKWHGAVFFPVTPGHDQISLFSEFGSIEIEIKGKMPVPQALIHRWERHSDEGWGIDQFKESWRWYSSYGFGRRTGTTDVDSSVRPPIVVAMTEYLLPDWFFAAIFAIMPFFWLILHLRVRHRIRSGCCTICGYDLRATPDRCPECGTVPKAASPVVKSAN